MYTTKRTCETFATFLPDWVVQPEEENIHLLQSAPIQHGNRTVSRYVNILIDKWFKEILGAEKNKEALIGILKELIPERKIADIHYGRKNKRKQNVFEKCRDAVFDVECTDEAGARFVVEMQLEKQKHFHERALFYSSFPIQEQVLAKDKKDNPQEHDKYFEYPPVYVISFLNFTFHRGSEQILYRYDLRERQTGELMTDRINFLFLEMPNAGDEEPSRDASFVQKLSWAFTHMSTLKERPVSLMGKVFEKFFAACEITAMDYNKQQEYTEDMTTKWDIHDQIATAWEEGRDEGREEGREEGRKEERLENARRLFSQGVSAETICQALGLHPEEFMGN